MKSNITILMLSFFLTFACKQEVKKEDTKEITNAEVIKGSKIEISENEDQQNNASCFTRKDIENLNLFFKSISNKDSYASMEASKIRFEEEDLKEIKDLLSKESFDYFKIKYDEVECDDSIGFFIWFREKFDDGDEVHYSEINDMYKLTKTNGIIRLKFLSTAG